MYYVKFSEHTYTITPPEDGPGEWLHQGDYGLDVHLMSIHKSEVSGWDVTILDDYQALYGYDDIEPGQPAHLVVVEYTTGGTFGSNGAWTIPAIKADAADAVEARQKCYDVHEGKYRAWDGYFEHLKSAEITTLVVSP